MGVTRVVALAACGCALAGCSWMPSWDFSFSVPFGSPTGVLTVESDPPGAEAKASTGVSCRTPCALNVPATDFTLTFDLPGFLPLTVPIRPRPPTDPREAGSIQFDPNPVFVQLQAAPPPPSKKKKAKS